ncbi:MAG: hypothetical protein KDC44_18880 [Phaeodactylibacter sp.]|nr:hypothetical protein [Phaeodactylibacter sp.]
MEKTDNVTARQIIVWLSEAAPVLIVLLATASFVLIGSFKADFYAHQYEPRFGERALFAGVATAALFGLVRLVPLITSFRDFSNSRQASGWLGLLGSFAMVWYEISEASAVAQVWNPSEPVFYSRMITFVVLLGVGLEIRAILTVGSLKDETIQRVNASQELPQKATQPKPATGKKPAALPPTDPIPQEEVEALDIEELAEAIFQPARQNGHG